MRRAGAIVLALVALTALLAPWLSPNDPDRRFTDLLYAPPTPVSLAGDAGAPAYALAIRPWRLEDRLRREFSAGAPVALRWFADGRVVTADPDAGAPLLLMGADAYGRDVYARLLHGARTTLSLAVVATIAATLLGLLAGGAAGAGSRWLDSVLSHVSEFILVIPTIYAALAVRAVLPLVLPASAVFALLAGIFAVLGAPMVARGVRAIVLSERDQEYVAAARAAGAGRVRLLVRHLLPAARGYAGVQATLLFPAFIVAESTLSYVGLGFPLTTPTWGTMLRDAANVSLMVDAPWLLAPAAVIFLAALGANLLVQGSGYNWGQTPMKRFTGLYTPITTPFAADDTLDEAALRTNIGYWMDSPLTGLVVLGSNGEAPQLDDAEADRVIAIAREHVPRDRPLIAGTGRESTRATIAATRRAAQADVDAVIVRTPSFFKGQMTTDAFVGFYTAVADASLTPVLLYNVTMYTGVTLLPEAVEKLAAHPNIVGIKESGGDMALMAEYVTRTPDDFTVLAGSATTFFNALCTGADGGVLALASLLPEHCRRLMTLVKEKRIDEARGLQRLMTPLARSVGGTYGVPGLKAALDLIGYTGGKPRPPLRSVGPQVIDIIRGQLETLDVLPAAAR